MFAKQKKTEEPRLYYSRRSKPRSTTSTSIKEVTNSPPSSATPLKNMVTSLGRSSAEQASLALNGTSLLQSLPSSWPPRNTSLDRSPVTPTMTMTPTMTLPPPMNRMTDLEYFCFFCGKRTGYLFLFSLCFLRLPTWRACHSQPLFATRTRVLKSASLK